jgi:L-alanine-DL-glutamate epimerase-like enolase superfamily enzyme
MEIDIDSVPWRDELFIGGPVFEQGELLLPRGVGWCVDVDEKAVRAHPPRN